MTTARHKTPVEFVRRHPFKCGGMDVPGMVFLRQGVEWWIPDEKVDELILPESPADCDLLCWAADDPKREGVR